MYVFSHYFHMRRPELQDIVKYGAKSNWLRICIFIHIFTHIWIYSTSMLSRAATQHSEMWRRIRSRAKGQKPTDYSRWDWAALIIHATTPVCRGHGVSLRLSHATHVKMDLPQHKKRLTKEMYIHEKKPAKETYMHEQRPAITCNKTRVFRIMMNPGGWVTPRMSKKI